MHMQACLATAVCADPQLMCTAAEVALLLPNKEQECDLHLRNALKVVLNTRGCEPALDLLDRIDDILDKHLTPDLMSPGKLRLRSLWLSARLDRDLWPPSFFGSVDHLCRLRRCIHLSLVRRLQLS